MLRSLLRLRNTLSRRTFPHDLAGLLDRPRRDAFWGFNGNFLRASLALALMRHLRCDAFVETGTASGETAFLVAAQTRLAVHACDADPTAIRRARRRLWLFRKRVHVSRADARDFLRGLAADGRLRRPFFYLDAHTADDLPLPAELAVIFSGWRDFVVMVDDFRVSHDPDFQHYRWGEQAQDLDYIAGTLAAAAQPMRVYFPAYPAGAETGQRSGWALLAPEPLAREVEAVCGGLVRPSP